MGDSELMPCPFCGGSLQLDAQIGRLEHPNNDCAMNPYGFAADRRDLIAAWNRRSLPSAGGEVEMRERAAQIFDKRAALHAQDAKWCGPQMQRYEGPRPESVEASPMNGPAIAYDREVANAAAIRSLSSASGGWRNAVLEEAAALILACTDIVSEATAAKLASRIHALKQKGER